METVWVVFKTNELEDEIISIHASEGKARDKRAELKQHKPQANYYYKQYTVED